MVVIGLKTMQLLIIWRSTHFIPYLTDEMVYQNVQLASATLALVYIQSCRVVLYYEPDTHLNIMLRVAVIVISWLCMYNTMCVVLVTEQCTA